MSELSRMRILQGVDLVEVARWSRLIQSHPGLIEEVFTERERAHCLARKEVHIHFAARFAAKEACLKALGRGFSPFGIDRVLREIEVVPRRSGRPELVLHGWAETLRRRRSVRQMTVSLSHTRDYAVATVVMLAEDPYCGIREGGWK